MRTVTVTAASRLHFGLFSFGPADACPPIGANLVREFGGVGLMIDAPAIRVRVCSATDFTAGKQHTARVRQTVDRLVECGLLGRLPACAVEVIETPAAHIGLGSGTQLSLAIATAVLTQQQAAVPETPALAAMLGRGKRSAIGTYGFARGGLLCDVGKLPGEAIAPPPERVELPPDWRVLLLLPQEGEGVSGDAERRAFETMPAVSANVAASLRSIAETRIMPAVREGSFSAFSESVYRLNYESGLCYAALQGGAYTTPRASRWIDRLRSAGVAGVGQTSWGPTLFAFFESPPAAERFACLIESQASDDAFRLLVSRPCNRSATMEAV